MRDFPRKPSLIRTHLSANLQPQRAGLVAWTSISSSLRLWMTRRAEGLNPRFFLGSRRPIHGDTQTFVMCILCIIIHVCRYMYILRICMYIYVYMYVYIYIHISLSLSLSLSACHFVHGDMALKSNFLLVKCQALRW